MPFKPGLHTFTGTATVNGRDVSIRGANGEEQGIAKVFAIAPAGSSPTRPTAAYLSPTKSMQPLSSVNPVRVQIDDEFEQFQSLEFSVNTGTPDDTSSHEVGRFSMTRNQCIPVADEYITCDIKEAFKNVENWKGFQEGTYFVKLKTSTKAETLPDHPDGISFNDNRYWSLPFVIDNTPPAATISGGPLSMIGGETISIKGMIDDIASEGTLYVDDIAAGLVAVEANGTWSYNLTTDEVGDHKIKILAKDTAGNTNDPTAETATATLTVNPFIPAPSEVQKVNDAAVGLTTPFAIPQALSKEDIPPAPSNNTNTDTAVLGAQDIKDSKADQSKVIAAVAPSAEGWKLFGITWFWWIILGLIVVVTGSWLLASKRQYATERILESNFLDH